ncbi:hypothetical protein NA57DRAFT_82007 [Rhizodiscina lignyota]|uniref:Uncharacterized protein n=1 Tax=Rhizodiscina lignyota TaxID=1504668 RepID=A0A9P4M4I2_9PEZI|nr:hypothetical protein NA57DRAFT_82007 [Rhizodiscina lignyota]
MAYQQQTCFNAQILLAGYKYTGSGHQAPQSLLHVPGRKHSERSNPSYPLYAFAPLVVPLLWLPGTVFPGLTASNRRDRGLFILVLCVALPMLQYLALLPILPLPHDLVMSTLAIRAWSL